MDLYAQRNLFLPVGGHFCSLMFELVGGFANFLIPARNRQLDPNNYIYELLSL